MGKIYYCENCGGVMEFDVETQALKCPNCETVVNIENHSERIVEHTLTRHALETIKVEEKTSSTMECKGCGAVVEVDSHSTASSCPYCGSSFVLAEKQVESIIPDGVIPFQINKIKVGEIFRNWIKRRWLAPNELKHLYQQDRLQGIYVPYWTFDADVHCPYTAQGGIQRVETYRDKDGKTQTRTRIDWYFTSGVVRHFFDDVLVKASDKLKESLLKAVEPYNTRELSSYSPDYLSGYSAECYSVELQSAYEEAHDDINNRLVALASEDVLQRFSHVRNVNISPQYKAETYKHILLPVYATSYTYKRKNYTVLVNGQTGEIKGDYPKSPIKIAILVILGIILFTVFYLFLSEGSEGQYRGQGNEVYETEIAFVEEEDILPVIELNR